MSLHERLRTATARAHQALETELDWQAQVATRAGYISLLARLRGFHAAYEPAIGAALDDEAFFGPRRRIALLDTDLACFGWDAGRIAALPTPNLASLRNRAEAMGALYVFEGSTLGGQFIAKHIGRLHGFDLSSGCAYYRGHGRATAAMWTAFCARLETLAGGAHEEAAFDAGIATFEAMRLWLTSREALAA